MRHTERFKLLAHNAKYRFLYACFPTIVDSLVRAATIYPSRLIASAGATKILIDNSVRANAITHETAWFTTGTKLWGEKIPIETGFAARIPVHNESDSSEIARSVRFLPAIASLARGNFLKLFTTPELTDEIMTQPMGRYSGYGYYDYNLFSQINLDRLPDPEYTFILGGTYSNFPTLEEQRSSRLANKIDPLFKGLVSTLGPNNSQDAWHIASAQKHGCYCFLTMDFKLIRNINAQRGSAAIQSLTTKVMSPEQFGVEFRLPAISPRLFSYHGAAFPVDTKMNWAGSRRQKPKKTDR